MTGSGSEQETSLIRTWIQERVGYIELNRPNKANAYNQALLNELVSALEQMKTDNNVCAMVICGAGQRSFCAGADLDEMKNMDHTNALNLRSSEIFSAIADYPKVTLAAINGAAVAGGLELALACDIRISSENARFFFPETELGLIPAAGGTHRLPKVVGIARAKEVILGGKVWLAEDALRFGLVSEVVDSDELLTRAQQWGEKIAKRDQLALQLAKKSINYETSYHLQCKYETLAEALLYEIKAGKR
jgi:enoyl-CoA hydratase